MPPKSSATKKASSSDIEAALADIATDFVQSSKIARHSFANAQISAFNSQNTIVGTSGSSSASSPPRNANKRSDNTILDSNAKVVLATPREAAPKQMHQDINGNRDTTIEAAEKALSDARSAREGALSDHFEFDDSESVEEPLHHAGESITFGKVVRDSPSDGGIEQTYLKIGPFNFSRYGPVALAK